MSVSSTSSSSTRKPGGTGKLRRSHFVPPCDSSVPLSSTLTVIDILYHCRDLARVLESAEPLDVIGTEIERAAFLELKMIFLRLELDDPARPPDQIDLRPFLEKLGAWADKDYLSNPGETVKANDKDNSGVGNALPSHKGMDVVGIWDTIVKLILVVIPPLREVFLGHVANVQEVPGWLNLMSRCFRANFTSKLQKLEDVCQHCYSDVTENYNPNNASNSSIFSSQTSNAMVLRRAPEVFVVSVNSTHLQLAGGKEDGDSAGSSAGPDAGKGLKSHVPGEISFPRVLDLTAYSGPKPGVQSSTQFLAQVALMNFADGAQSSGPDWDKRMDHTHKLIQAKEERIYDLTATVVLESSEDLPADSPDASFRMQTYFRQTNTSPGDDEADITSGDSFSPEEGAGAPEPEPQWFRSSFGSQQESVAPVTVDRAVEQNYFSTADNARVHPRLLVYTRRKLGTLLKRTSALVTKSGQMRALGDVAFALAMTSENFDEARKCYEEAMSLDENIKDEVKENLESLEKFEKTQKARKLEEQADLALANRRFKEASDLYKTSMRTSLLNSGIYERVKEKERLVGRILALEGATHLVERGESSLNQGLPHSMHQSREMYSQAHRLCPEFSYLQSYIQVIDKTIQVQLSSTKETEGHAAMKALKYRLANTLFNEAISLDADKETSLQDMLERLVPLMQGEDALTRQKSGMLALEDKQYEAALVLLTEAIDLLPPNSTDQTAGILADRAHVHNELKDFATALEDCSRAIELHSTLAIAHFRLGAAHFGLNSFDAAIASYDRALKYDSSLSDQIKAKMRQVSSAREVQQRKQREEERALEKEKQEKLLKEKREKEEQKRRDKAEQNAKEAAERKAKKDIENTLKAEKEAEKEAGKESKKEEEAEQKKREKAEAVEQKKKDRETAKAKKEEDRREAKAAIERKEQVELDRKAEELRKRREFEQEQERAFARQRKEKAEEAEKKEKARLEREKTIAEREKARKEKLANAANAASVAAAAAASNKASNAAPADESNSKKGTKMSLDPAIVALNRGVMPARTTSPAPGTLNQTAAEKVASASASSVPPPTGPPVNSWASRGGLLAKQEQRKPPLPPAIAAIKKAQEEFPPLGGEMDLNGPRSRNNSLTRSPVLSSNLSQHSSQQQLAHEEEDSGGWDGLGHNLDQSALLNVLDDAMDGNMFVTDLSASSREYKYNGPVPNNGSDSQGESPLTLQPSAQDSPALGGLAGPGSNSAVTGMHDPLASLGRSLDRLGLGSGLGSGAAQIASGDSSSGDIFSSHSSSSINGTSGGSVMSANSGFGVGSNPLNNPFGGGLGFGFGSLGLGGNSALSGPPTPPRLGSGGSDSHFVGLGGLDSLDSLGLDDSAGLEGSLDGGLGLQGLGLTSDGTDPIHRALAGLGSALDGNDTSGSTMGLSSSSDAEGGLSGGLSMGASMGGMGSSFLGGGGGSGHSLLGGLGASSPQDSGLGLGLGLGASFSSGHQNQNQNNQNQNQEGQNQNQGSAFGGSMSPSPGQGQGHGGGIDGDVVHPDMCQSMFPAVAWLNQYGINMYHWAGDSSEWTEYALNVPTEILRLVVGPNGAALQQMQSRTGCRVRVDSETLHNRKENFLVFYRGASGQESNMAMNQCLTLVSDVLRQIISYRQQNQSQPNNGPR